MLRAVGASRAFEPRLSRIKLLHMLCAVASLLLLTTACPQAEGNSKNTLAGDAGAAAGQRDGGEPMTSPSAMEVAAGLPLGSAPKGASFTWLKTRDQYNVAAWYFGPKVPKVKGAQAPAILLLHMRGKDKSSWGALPAKLVDEGFAVLSIDLRGHGETLDPQGRSLPLNSLDDSDYQNMLFDVAAGHDYLAQQSGVDPERLGIIGASIGANLGLMYCSKDRRVRTVVALSPGVNYKSLEPLPAMDGVDKRAIYLVASSDDLPSVEACEKLAASGNQEGVKSVRMFEGSAHGTDLFSAHKGFDDTIVGGWLLNTIPPRR